MAIGIYKSGQGYWVRVLTATMLGVITFATAAWTFAQMASVAEKLPKSIWAMPVRNVEGGVFVPGSTVDLLGKAQPGVTAPSIGTAVVQSFGQGELRVRDVKLNAANGDSDPGFTSSIRSQGVPGGAGGTITAEISSRINGLSAISPTILQGIAASIVIVIGFLITYYFCATKPSSVEFLISTDMEMKKVNWSTKKDITRSTMVVVFAAIFLAGTLFIIDVVFQSLFKAIGVLQG